jgi:hypothetical protein
METTLVATLVLPYHYQWKTGDKTKYYSYQLLGMMDSEIPHPQASYPALTSVLLTQQVTIGGWYDNLWSMG